MILKITDRFKNRQVEFFNNFTFNLVHDSVASTFSFDFFFDPDNPGHKELACVSHYHECTMEDNGELLLTGFIISQGFEVRENKQLARFSGYSKPGVLEDCEIPPDLYPLQSNNLSLKQIAEKLIRPFKLKMVIDPSVSDRMNKVFKASTASETSTVKAYLTDLAKQKNIVISHNEKGELLFTESKAKGVPILDFDLNKPSLPLLSCNFVFDGQKMHSHITLQKQASSDGGNAGQYTIRNPYVLVVYRPTVKSQSSGDDNDTSLAARRELSSELKNLKWTIALDRWYVNNKIIKPNNTITVISPELYGYVKVTLFIESINFVGNAAAQTCTLNCVLPEVYTNEIPVSIFKGINLYPNPHV